MHPRAAELIAELRLEPHPEGGYYRELFRSGVRVRRVSGGEALTAMTTIYYLLAAGEHSRWHRVASDEIWHWYEGEPLWLYWLEAGGGGEIRRELLGPVSAQARPVWTVPAGCWQAARPAGTFTLAGCSVGPGFEFDEFRLMADSDDVASALRVRDPELARLI